MTSVAPVILSGAEKLASAVSCRVRRQCVKREEWLRVVEMRGPGPIPCRPALAGSLWNQHREKLQEVVNRYPELWEGSPPKGQWTEFNGRHAKDERTKDRWGCTWDNIQCGIIGQVVEHPLADWDALDELKPPDPAKENDFGDQDWKQIEADVRAARERGDVTWGYVSHGFLFQRIYYLRGFENAMIDFATNEPRLARLIEMIVEFNAAIVRRYLDLGVDCVGFGDDMGMQERFTIAPDTWRRHIKPAYARLFGMCRKAGAHVHLHSDGYILDVLPDLIEIGVTIPNPQDLVNGLDNIRRVLKGKVCIDLDIDRQKILPWGTPAQVDEHIRRCIETLGSRQGGLMLICGVYAPTPLENVEALLKAMSKYRMMFA
jgi:uroporphyrinogen decarboxylase